MTSRVVGERPNLLARTADLIAIPSVSRNERAIADLVEEELRQLPWLEVTRFEDNVVARTSLDRDTRVVLAGHLDTVPPASEDVAVPRVEGDTLWGVGAADMKGGIAVLLDLASRVAEPLFDVTWCFYACEEVARSVSGLRALQSADPSLVAGDVAVLCEPTGGVVEAGCQGAIRAAIHTGGIRAHVARPFAGRNAIHRLSPILARVADWGGRSIVLDGCEYVEQLQAVGIGGGVAGNVLPDDASLTVNYRFAPDRDVEEARTFLVALIGDEFDADAGDHIDLEDAAAGALPHLHHPVLTDLVAATGAPPRAKVGWTDVATFSEWGIPATNFGPGDPLFAHHPDEHVTRGALEHASDVLMHLLLGEDSPTA